jgi:hypothetical protein
MAWGAKVFCFFFSKKKRFLSKKTRRIAPGFLLG